MRKDRIIDGRINIDRSPPPKDTLFLINGIIDFTRKIAIYDET